MTDKKKCAICKRLYCGHGNNAEPVMAGRRCCDICNAMFVIPGRRAAVALERAGILEIYEEGKEPPL